MDLLKVRRMLEDGKTIFDVPLRVVYYARVSTDHENQLNSLENQSTYYETYIKEKVNWIFAGGYVDEGLSAGSVEKRENFQRMIQDALKGEFDLIITKEICRFARNTLDSIKYTRDLLEGGVAVFFQGDNINTISSDSELRLTIMSSLAQDEIRRLSERVKFGMRQAYAGGKVLGNSSIYGYVKNNGILMIDEETAPFVRDLFDLYSTGRYGFRTVARMLTEKGYRNQVGKDINPASLKAILTNPKYKGFYHGRLTESSSYLTKKNKKLPREEHLCYKDEGIPALVSEEMWDKVNKIIAGRTEKYMKKSSGTQSRFPYSGKIQCGEHGTFHYRKVWKDRRVPAESWCCREYLARGRVACKTSHVYTRDLDAIMEYIGRDLLNDKKKYQKNLDELLDMYSRPEKGNASFAKQMAKAEKELVKFERQKQTLLELYSNRDIDLTEYKLSGDLVSREIERCRKKLSGIREEEKIIDDMDDALCQAKKFFDDLANLGKLPLEVARELLDRAVVRQGNCRDYIKIHIYMRYGEMLSATIVHANILYGDTEVNPIVGTEKQSEELITYLLQEFNDDPIKIWDSNIFGKSLNELVNEGLQNKLNRMPEDARLKLQETLSKIINEGSGGLICIIL